MLGSKSIIFLVFSVTFLLCLQSAYSLPLSDDQLTQSIVNQDNQPHVRAKRWGRRGFGRRGFGYGGGWGRRGGFGRGFGRFGGYGSPYGFYPYGGGYSPFGFYG
ncbi:hypothetical protein M3Y98_00565500 [Aphelenchoides besseyi]|nr:hypothetical protein M3Y98_00565500 [Aphelenchoides besseyi]KAI6193803.1 hypothetical protein M3Y96_01057400 [Aphelenchoides besseyi]